MTNSPAASGGNSSGYVPAYGFIDIDQLLDEDEELDSLAESAAKAVCASLYPPLPMMDDDDHPIIDPAIDPALDPAINQATTDETTPSSTSTQSSSTPNPPATAYPLRPVPHVANAAQQVQEDSINHATQIRTVEGNFRAALHHLLMVQTGKNSYRARQRLPEKEHEYFDKVKADIDAQLPGVDGAWYTQDDRAKPFSDRLQHLLFSALLAQSGQGVVSADPTQFTDECYLEARRWTLDMLRELTEMALHELDSSEHLRTTRQLHLVLPSN